MIFIYSLLVVLGIPIVTYQYIKLYHNNLMIDSLKNIIRNENSLEHKKIQEYAFKIVNNLI